MGLYISVRGFRGGYIGKGLYPRGIYNWNFKKKEQAIAVLIKIQFTFTGFLISFETS